MLRCCRYGSCTLSPDLLFWTLHVGLAHMWPSEILPDFLKSKIWNLKLLFFILEWLSFNFPDDDDVTCHIFFDYGNIYVNVGLERVKSSDWLRGSTSCRLTGLVAVVYIRIIGSFNWIVQICIINAVFMVRNCNIFLLRINDFENIRTIGCFYLKQWGNTKDLVLNI